MIKPRNDYVLIEPVREEKTKGGIIIPETAQGKPAKAKVVAVGPGRTENGKRVPIDIKKGEIVIVKNYSEQVLKADGKEYWLVKEDNIVAIN